MKLLKWGKNKCNNYLKSICHVSFACFVQVILFTSTPHPHLLQTTHPHTHSDCLKVLKQLSLDGVSYYNSSSVSLCVCLCVCSLSPLRSFGGSSPNLVDVCRWTSHLPLRGSFSKRSMGRRVNGSLSLSTILYMRQPHATQLQRRLLLCCYCI